MDIVEPFCGSAVLSANLARTSVLNDRDEFVCKILSRFDELEVPEVFTQKDYARCRGLKDWWKYAYCLQKMGFSGVFRYSKNGYNVPVKPEVKKINVRKDYELALRRWKKLKPTVLNQDYLELPHGLIVGKLLILDPPYEESQASYNANFNYDDYWQFVEKMKSVAAQILLFDRKVNLAKKGIPIIQTRKMRVNGARSGDTESIALFSKGIWQEDLGFTIFGASE